MPKIKMKEPHSGSPDGIVTKLYLEGREYDVNDLLADAFVMHLGVAEFVNKGKKSELKAPDNASMDITTDTENADASSDIEDVAENTEVTDIESKEEEVKEETEEEVKEETNSELDDMAGIDLDRAIEEDAKEKVKEVTVRDFAKANNVPTKGILKMMGKFKIKGDKKSLLSKENQDKIKEAL